MPDVHGGAGHGRRAVRGVEHMQRDGERHALGQPLAEPKLGRMSLRTMPLWVRMFGGRWNTSPGKGPAVSSGIGVDVSVLAAVVAAAAVIGRPGRGGGGCAFRRRARTAGCRARRRGRRAALRCAPDEGHQAGATNNWSARRRFQQRSRGRRRVLRSWSWGSSAMGTSLVLRAPSRSEQPGTFPVNAARVAIFASDQRGWEREGVELATVLYTVDDHVARVGAQPSGAAARPGLPAPGRSRRRLHLTAESDPDVHKPWCWPAPARRSASGYDLKGQLLHHAARGGLEDGGQQPRAPPGHRESLQAHLGLPEAHHRPGARPRSGRRLLPLQMLCDISVAADDAVLGHPVVKLGGVSSMPLWQVLARPQEGRGTSCSPAARSTAGRPSASAS